MYNMRERERRCSVHMKYGEKKRERERTPCTGSTYCTTTTAPLIEILDIGTERVADLLAKDATS